MVDNGRIKDFYPEVPVKDYWEVKMEEQEKKPCPLCGTLLPYDKWLKVVGVYEEQQKYRKQLEAELSKAKEKTKRLTDEYKKLRKQERQIRAQYKQQIQEERKRIKDTLKGLKEKERTLKLKLERQYKIQYAKLRERFEKEKKFVLARARREGIKIGSEKGRVIVERLKKELEKIKTERENAVAKLKQRFQKEQERLKKRLEIERQREVKRALEMGMRSGMEKQKARVEMVAKKAEKLRKERDELYQRVKELEDMIKKGTTPQLEGYDFERETATQLRSRFPEDEVKLTGRKGDILQIVKVENKEVGKILYECKKTKEFFNKFIEQIRRDKAKAMADYGVIVTWAQKEDKQGFWVEGDIIIVHPYGVLDIATVLREMLVQMYTLKLSKSEVESKGKALLEFIQSEEFRTRIQQSINKSLEAYELLKKEVKTHVNTWRKRQKIYEIIYKNTEGVKEGVRYVLLRGKTPERLTESKKSLALPILSEKQE